MAAVDEAEGEGKGEDEGWRGSARTGDDRQKGKETKGTLSRTLATRGPPPLPAGALRKPRPKGRRSSTRCIVCLKAGGAEDLVQGEEEVEGVVVVEDKEEEDKEEEEEEVEKEEGKRGDIEVCDGLDERPGEKPVRGRRMREEPSSTAYVIVGSCEVCYTSKRLSKLHKE